MTQKTGNPTAGGATSGVRAGATASGRNDAFLNAHAALIRRVEEALATAGLPPLSWYDVLLPLYRAPDRTLRMGELALAGHARSAG